MNGCYSENKLYDHVDGVLSKEEGAQVAQHLAECSVCRASTEQLRTLIESAASLPREIEPERDLWPGIAERIDEEETVVRPRFDGQSPPRPKTVHAGLLATAAAAVAIAALAVGLLAGDPEGSSGGRVFIDPMGGGSQEVLLAEYQAAGTEYQGAIDQLIRTFDARREDLSPETIDTVEESLRVVDEAILQARAALEKDSADSTAGRMYASMYQRKLDLLRFVSSLPSEI